MELLFPFIVMAVGVFFLKSRDERGRIALLGQHLSQYQIEKLMETLTEGYLRALGENGARRSGTCWRARKKNLLTSSTASQPGLPKWMRFRRG